MQANIAAKPEGEWISRDGHLSRSFKVMYDKKEHKRNLRSLSYSSRVMLDLDKSHACMKILQISRTEWTPVHEQNKVARKLVCG